MKGDRELFIDSAGIDGDSEDEKGEHKNHYRTCASLLANAKKHGSAQTWSTVLHMMYGYKMCSGDCEIVERDFYMLDGREY